MTTKEKKILSKCFEDVIWMAIRYADGRHTYAPSMVRDAIRDFKEIYPDWKPKHDITIKKPSDDKIEGMSFASDYLWDLFESKTNEQ